MNIDMLLIDIGDGDSKGMLLQDLRSGVDPISEVFIKIEASQAL